MVIALVDIGRVIWPRPTAAAMNATIVLNMKVKNATPTVANLLKDGNHIYYIYDSYLEVTMICVDNSPLYCIEGIMFLDHSCETMMRIHWSCSRNLEAIHLK